MSAESYEISRMRRGWHDLLGGGDRRGRPRRRHTLRCEPLETRRMLAGWPVRIGGAGYDQGADVAVLADGSALVTGMFGSTVAFDGTALTSAAITDGYVARLNPSGSFAWAKQIGGTGVDAGTAIDAFPDGSAIVAGYFTDSVVTIGGTTLTSAAGAKGDVFIARVNADGTFAWAKKAGGAGSDMVSEVIVSKTGDGTSLVAGYFGDGGSFDSTTLTGYGGFVAKLHADGSYAWVQKVPGDVLGMTSLADGSLLVTGGFGSTQAFGDTALVSAGNWDAYVAKLNPDGSIAWATRAGWTGFDAGYGISATPDGGAVVTGMYQGTAWFGVTTLPNSGQGDIFVAKVNPNGTFGWVARAGGVGVDSGTAVVTCPDGSVVITGQFEETVTFGGTTLTSSGKPDIFIAKAGTDGVFTWARRAGGPDLDQGRGVAARPDGAVLVTGLFQNPAKFGGTSFVAGDAAGSYESFVAKVTAAGVIESAPFEPTNVTGVAGFGEVTLKWTAPESNGLPITSYGIAYRSTNQRIPTWTYIKTDADLAPTATTRKVTGLLSDSTQYIFRVKAFNASGPGDFSVVSAPVYANNKAPTAVALSSASVAENKPVGAVVGTLSTTDPDAADTFTYTIVPDPALNGTGKFEIVGNQLRTKVVFDYEATASYSVRIRSTDQGGQFIGKVFTVAVTDANDPPTDVLLTPATVAENQPVGTVVGTLSATDPNPGDTFTYVIVPDPNLDGTGKFALVGNVLRTLAVFDHEAKSSYSLRVRAIDQGGAIFGKVLTIAVTNVNETPTAVLLSSATVLEKQPAGTVVGTLSTTDPDAGNTFKYIIVPDPNLDGTGMFEIVGGQLRTKAVFNAAVKSSYSVRIRSTDQGGLFTSKVFTITVAG